MILFYDKDSGQIIGTVNGRLHGEDHLKMWIGDKNTTRRLVVNWKKDKDNWKAEIQPEIFEELEKESSSMSKYRVNNELLEPIQ